MDEYIDISEDILYIDTLPFIRECLILQFSFILFCYVSKPMQLSDGARNEFIRSLKIGKAIRRNHLGPGWI